MLRGTIGRVALAVMLLSIVAPASAQEVTLRFGTGLQSASATWKENVVGGWIKQVEESSGGALKFSIHGDGSLTKFGGTVDGVKTGIADVGWEFPALYGARFASLGIMGLPGMYTDAEKGARALWRGFAAGKIGKELAAEVKVAVLQAATPNLIMTKEPLKSTTDLTGVKIMVATKEQAELIAAMGGVPVTISYPEVPGALQKGVIDGVMMTPIGIQGLQLQEVIRHYYIGPFGGNVTMMVMNKDKYDALPEKAKKAIDAHTGEDQSAWHSTWLIKYGDAFMDGKILAIPGNQKHVLSKEEIAKWQPAFEKVAKGWIARNPGGAEAYEAFKAEVSKLE